jgi:DTW domain-containing protein YfiP
MSSVFDSEDTVQFNKELRFVLLSNTWKKAYELEKKKIELVTEGLLKQKQ